MASSNDFEKIWESYQEVVKTKDISIVDYCQRNDIVYSQFQRWYKKHVSGVNIVPVSVPDFQTESSMISEDPIPSQHLSGHVSAKVKYVNIEFSNGLKVLVYSHNLYRLYDLSYDKGLSFMKIENEDGTPVTGSKPIEWKYLVALLNCPVRKKLVINSN